MALCVFYEGMGFDQGSTEIEFFVSEGFDNDVDTGNNFQDVVFGIKPHVISTLNKLSLFWMMVLLLIIGSWLCT